ncbi:hypothetical protein FHX39_001543 [Friedmanniella antarctica]|uniref:Uncharacterized protein n=1 Tax=Microlunatus antarcticus TaxID=53388 RepID=A0A7W5P6K1_9ACTN|nr:hypothetical protein [Microlunatus antarcticus]
MATSASTSSFWSVTEMYSPGAHRERSGDESG